MFGSGGGRDSDRDAGRAAMAQRRRVPRQSSYSDDEEEDEGYTPHRSSGGFIKRDLQFGLALAALLGILIGPRLLPNIEPSDSGKAPAGELATPVAAADARPTLPVAAPVAADPAPLLPLEKAKQSPLTDILPKGYAPAETKPKDEKKADDKLMAPVLPPPKSMADDSVKSSSKREPLQNAARKSDVVTEFVPYQERTDKKTTDEKPNRPISAGDSELQKPQAIVPPNYKKDALEPPTRTKLVGLPSESIEKSENGVKVRSFEGNAEKAKPGSTSAGTSVRPVHPFFQRYLEEREYPVRYGDTLEIIAYRLYGDEGKAEAIRKANPELLGESRRVRSGMRLKLP